MELKDAYKQALTAELKPLVEEGKLIIKTTVEDLAIELTQAVFRGLKGGAVLSKTPYDDITVPPFVDMLEPRIISGIKKVF